MFKRNKKIFLAGLVVFILVGAVWPGVVIGADGDKPAGATAESTIKDTGTIAYAIYTISGWFLAFIAGLINFAITLGDSVLDLAAVKTGWAIVLQFTNLGFILGIIVIAFATILRLESYALKQILWKLIVAALLVNFSLVIAGSVMSVSKIATDYFLQATNAENLSNALGNAFNPQQFSQVKDPSSSGVTGVARDVLSGDFFSKAIKYLLSILFVVIFLFLMILAFLTLFVMLMVRIIALAFLLILSPIVWLLWIFPSTVKYWHQWWNEFIRWNFFAPAVMFFVYLTVLTSQSLDKIGGVELSNAQRSTMRAAESIGFANNEVLAHAANLTILLGLLYGGIYVANKFGIAGGSIGVNLAQKVGKGVGAWAGRKGVRIGTLPFRGKYGRDIVENLQKGDKGVYKVAKYLGGQYLGHGLSRIGVMQGEKLVKEAEDKQKGLSDKQLALRVSTMTREERTAALARLTKNKNLDMVPNAAKYIDDKEKKLWESYGQGKTYGDFEKTIGFNAAVKNAKNPKERSDAMKEFRKSYSIKDYDKLQGNILGGKEVYGLGKIQDDIKSAVLESIFDQHPGAVSKLRSNLKGDDLKNFQQEVDNYIDKFEQNLPDNLRGIKISIKSKIQFIDSQLKEAKTDVEKEKWRYFSNQARGLYNSQKSFGGSLFGGYSLFGEEGAEEKKEEEKKI